jgi:hypothetical protein
VRQVGRVGQVGCVGSDLRGERGVALLIAIAALFLMSTVTAALVLITSVETAIAANYRNSVEALYAADAIAERAIAELATIPDWDTLLAGLVSSSFIDGPPTGTRRLPGGATVDVTRAVSLANCGKPITCSAADIAGNPTGDRPWGPDNPVWNLFAYGSLDAVLSTIDSPFYVLVMVAGDPAERAGIPAMNSPADGNAGIEVILVRAEAFGLRDVHKVVELTVGRVRERNGREGQDRREGQDGQDGRERHDRIGTLRVLSWREVR